MHEPRQLQATLTKGPRSLASSPPNPAWPPGNCPATCLELPAYDCCRRRNAGMSSASSACSGRGPAAGVVC